MSRIRLVGLCALLVIFTSATGSEDNTTGSPKETVMQIMLTTITPASDTLWSVNNPQTEEAWKILDDAAVTLIAALEKIRLGGAGPNDAAWAKQEKYLSYIDADIAAANAARTAIAARDLDALFDANNALYTPCESCHIDFNPGISGAEN